MRLTFFGGLTVDGTDATGLARGRGQAALLLRLAVDAGTAVSYRALAEDVWGADRPVDPRAALQSLVARLRRALPPGLVAAAAGGYRLDLTRDDVDVTRFQDLVACARRDADGTAARAALALWVGDPFLPDGFEWLARDLLEDRAHAERLTRTRVAAAPDVAESAVALPAALSTLVGRADERALISEQLALFRLVTLLGPGGAGKTTLAVETARASTDTVFVELAPTAAGEVWDAVATAATRSLRVPEPTTVPLTAPDLARRALHGRAVLIVLDNCEHVIAEAAAVAAELLRQVPSAQILATSREPLGIPGEAFVEVGPLPESDARELFARRVRAARGHAPSAAEAPIAARVVAHLDGLPLAVELAAAKARTLTLDEIEAGLADRFALLAHGPRTADRRHRTLRALIDWSWDTLTPPERVALLAVSVFPDGLGIAAAGSAASAFETDAAAFDLLVERSLLRRVDGRFRMLETVREYGRDRLHRSGDAELFGHRLATVVAEHAARADALLRGPRVREGLAWFDANAENVTAALRVCRADPAMRGLGVRLVRAALWAWTTRDRFDELQRALADFGGEAPLADESAVVVQAAALLASTLTAAMRPNAALPDVAAFRERSARISDAASRFPSPLSAALPTLLAAALDALERPVPERPWSRKLAIGADPADAPAWTRAVLALLRAAMAHNDGDVDALGRQSERALALFDEAGDPWGTAFASQLRGEWLLLRGRAADALDVAEAARESMAGLTAASDVIQQHALAVSALLRLGRIADARVRVAEILATAAADGSARVRFEAAATAAGVEIAAGDAAAALRYVERATDAASGGEDGPEQLRAWRDTITAKAQLLLGDTDAAQRAARRAVAPAVRSGDRPVIADVAAAVAACLEARGRTDPARRAFAASVRLRGGLDATDPWTARLREALGADAEAAPEDWSPDAAQREFERLAELLD